MEWMSHHWSMLDGFNDRQELFLLQILATKAIIRDQSSSEAVMQRGQDWPLQSEHYYNTLL